MQYLCFLLVLLVAVVPFAALPLAQAQPAPAYAACLMRGHQ